MNKRIRNMIDGIFCEMKMTAENLALRDELMSNAIARYEDAIAHGKPEEEAFAEVAGSLEDVNDLLREMNSGSQESGEESARQAKDEMPDAQEAQTGGKNTEDDGEAVPQTDLGDALNKAFSMLGDWGQSIMPQAKRIARQVDDATGGMIRDIGRAVNKGMRDAQKAAGDVLDRMQQEKAVVTDATPEEMREYAKDLRAQADIKRAIHDEEGAKALDEQAQALETQAEIMEQEEAIRQASRSAQQEARPKEESPFAPSCEDEIPPQRPVYGADGELDEDAFAQSVEQMSREAESLVREAGETIEEIGRQAQDTAEKAGSALHDAVYGKSDPQHNEVRFPAAGLRRIDVKLDADDVMIEPVQGEEIIVRWSAKNVEGEPEVVMHNHTLSVRRKNPDVFKTFFSVFSKDGGQVSIFIPCGYAADYILHTTSGDVRLSGVDVDDVKISTTSGDVRVEPDAAVRARDIQVETVSGDATVSAMAVEISTKSVSGDVFVSCDAGNVSGEVVSGDLHVEGAVHNLDVDAVSGEIRLICTVVPSGKVKADSLSGEISILLPGSIRGFALNYDTMSGQLTNEFGPERFGTCALPIEVGTLSGSLTIARL